MMKMRIAAAGAAAAITAAVLVACGGDSSGQAAQVAGVVLDGSGTQQVFLDLNQNQRADADEPSTPVSADGSFVLPIGKRSAGEIASALLVASVSGGASTLTAPASAFITFDGAKQKTSPAVISPLTTLAAAGVVVNGLTGSEAAELVQSHLGLDKTPLTNYQSSPDRVLQSLARGAATALTAAADGATDPSGTPSIAIARNGDVLTRLNESTDSGTTVTTGIELRRLAPDGQPAAGVGSAHCSVPSAATSRSRSSLSAHRSSMTRVGSAMRGSMTGANKTIKHACWLLFAGATTRPLAQNIREC